MISSAFHRLHKNIVLFISKMTLDILGQLHNVTFPYQETRIYIMCLLPRIHRTYLHIQGTRDILGNFPFFIFFCSKVMRKILLRRHLHVEYYVLA